MKVEKVGRQVPDKPYRDQEFEAFLKTLKNPTVQAHWKEIAENIGVDDETVSRWSRHPLARQARREGIAIALQGMMNAGAKDWRMYESKLKFLRFKPTDEDELKKLGTIHLQITTNGNQPDTVAEQRLSQPSEVQSIEVRTTSGEDLPSVDHDTQSSR